MNNSTYALPAMAIAALLLAGCGEQNTVNTGAVDESGGIRDTEESGQNETEHVAQGTLNSVDAAAGTVNISHGPVASAGWPAMTMTFQLADPSLAAELEPGQRVEFRFRTEGGSATVTEISPAATDE